MFRFDVPAGYTVKTQKRHRVNEKEMIDFIRVLVQSNDNVFPRQIDDIPCDVYNKYRAMPKSARPPQAERLIETADYYSADPDEWTSTQRISSRKCGLGQLPLFGQSAKLGDKDAIVCWYRLRDAKAPNTYRVVYGDLSVKDVMASDLPLPINP